MHSHVFPPRRCLVHLDRITFIILLDDVLAETKCETTLPRGFAETREGRTVVV